MTLAAPLPTGAVTFAFTDIEGSAARWERDRAAMQEALRRHDAIMRAAISEHGGHVFKTIGDAFCAAFARPEDAVAAMLATQRALTSEDFSAIDGLRVRAALCTGTADEREGDYFGPAVNRVARLMAAAAGGQVLVSQSSAKLLEPSGIALRDLGEHRLKGLDDAEQIFQLVADDLPSDFPPLRSVDSEDIHATPGFTGRDDELAAVAEALDSDDAIAAVHGLGGTGKSSLAREYAWRNRNRYSVTWWLNAQTETGIVDGLVRLGELFVKGLDQLDDRRAAAQQVVRSTLSGFTKPVLLIFDNLEDERLLRAWQPKTSSHLLATSRNTAWSADVRAIALDVWPVETAVSYLQRESGRVDLTEADARAIAEALGSLPLAMSHAAASLRGMRTVAPQRYLQRIAEHLKNAPHDAEYPRSVFATFSTSIAQAEYQAAGAGAVLCFAASFAPDAIPDELFRQPIDRYPQGLHPAVPGRDDALDLRSAVADELRLDGCLGALDRLSLLTFATASRSYSLHRLVQFAAHDLAIDDAHAWQQCAMSVADAAFPEGDFLTDVATRERCERLVAHVAALAGWANFDDVWPQTAGLVLIRTGLYLQARGRPSEALPLLEHALSILERALGPDHLDVAKGLSTLAGVQIDLGRYAEALTLQQRALAIRERTLGPDHVDVAKCLNNIAFAHFRMGRPSQALALHERAQSILERALGADHPLVAQSLNNQAIILEALGRHAEAQPLCERMVSILERAHGPDHPHLAKSLADLASNHYQQGRYAQALTLYERALPIGERTLGPEHVRVTYIRESLAEVRWIFQGRNAEARKTHEGLLAIRERVFGPDHFEVATSLCYLGSVHQREGRYVEARALLERSRAIRQHVFGPDHPDVADCLDVLGQIDIEQGRRDAAQQSYEHSLSIREGALGRDHPSVASSLNGLASVSCRRGRCAEARVLFERALMIQERALGPDHPAVAETLLGLASLGNEEGNSAEAIGLYERALIIAERTFAPDHPKLAKIRTTLDTLRASPAK